MTLRMHRSQTYERILDATPHFVLLRVFPFACAVLDHTVRR